MAGRVIALLMLLVATKATGQTLPTALPSDLGGSGLLQIPTAQIGDDGDVAAFASVVAPYRRFGVSGTALPWAQLVLRFSEIEDVPYGPAAFSGRQSYLDRGIDARIRLIKQGDYLPDVTLGLRDIAGTGLFDAEYLVATGAFDDVDVTLGLGWGQLASNHMFANPLAFIAGDSRPVSGAAGSLRGDYFAGPSMSLFGGVAIRTPLPGLTLQLEYNPDDGRQDPFRSQTRVRVSNPVDAGVVYQPTPWLAVSAGYERGNTAMLKLALLGNVAVPSPVTGPRAVAPVPSSSASVLLDPDIARDLLIHQGWRLVSERDEGSVRQATIAWVGEAAGPVSSESIGRVARAFGHLDPAAALVDLTIIQDGRERSIVLDTRALELAIAETGRAAPLVDAALGQTAASTKSAVAADPKIRATIVADLDALDFTLDSVELDGPQAVIRFHQDIYRVATRAIGTAARAILADLPPEIALVTFGIVEDGVDVARVSLLRHELDAAFRHAAASDEILHHAAFSAGAAPGAAAMIDPGAYPSVDYSLRPGLKTDTAGPDGLLLYDLDVGVRADVAFAPGSSITGELAASLASNFDRLKLVSDSLLPHVRSDIADYLRDGKYGIARLQTDLIRQPLTDLYVRFSGGLLEDMFGGVDGEVLYRPYDADWAIGADVNHVWQRGFHERFGFRPYQVTTAVLEGYERLGWYGLTVGAKFGRYLAGDAGGTIELSRTFESGVKLGAFATLTTASGRQFGEGRFDKGFYISVPLDQLIGFASRDTLDYTYRPVTRDGGQLIDIDKPLYDLTNNVGPRDLTRDWTQLLQ